MFGVNKSLNVMEGAGFVVLDSEWWHFDFGNQFWAKQKGVKAIYGSTKPQEQSV
ncbi:hypothetical protein HYZ78_00135 [Candidatus Microgenomates bacterium]|nr:hypothetical protein [Candidatus Microgenomates bacterium]